MTNPAQVSVAAQVANLPALPMADLWGLWDRFFRRRPGKVNRTYLEARIAYKLQEAVYGGLSDKTRQRLIQIGQQQSKISQRPPREVLQFVPGTVMVREYGGEEHRVTVTAVRLKPEQHTPLDYYLLPRIDFGLPSLQLGEHNPLQWESYRFDTLDYLYGMAERRRVRRAA
jgi:hypothetical protein